MDLHESAMEEGPMGSAELANSVFISDDIIIVSVFCSVCTIYYYL